MAPVIEIDLSDWRSRGWLVGGVLAMSLSCSVLLWFGGAGTEAAVAAVLMLGGCRAWRREPITSLKLRQDGVCEAVRRSGIRGTRVGAVFEGPGLTLLQFPSNQAVLLPVFRLGASQRSKLGRWLRAAVDT